MTANGYNEAIVAASLSILAFVPGHGDSPVILVAIFVVAILVVLLLKWRQ